jgi:hypothetical protein
MIRATALSWVAPAAAVLIVLLAASIAGCAGRARLPECHGPWAPIPVEPEDHRNG